MAGPADDEEKRLKRMFEENSSVHSKRLFLFLSLIVLGSIFAIFITALAQSSNFISFETVFEFTKTELNHRYGFLD